ncbi:DsbA family oxidoreductase [Mucilaginibacter sp. PAMB04274]|uniref:DsbA family oxidoreductase n=1 Tax=Mucilaginibacter sp. PAMB04274 TaxID=3138568 RepID=UPI0031F656E1
MKVQIWSDVMCPFCYIGKRHFEEALSAFEHNDVVEVEWKSFQLNPALKTNPDISVYQSLADSKGWNLDYAKQLSNQVTEMAEQAGLQYNFDRAVVANSFNAHRLSHLAKKHGLGDALEERLFKAYFTDGLNIDDKEALVNISTEIGLKAEEVTAVVDSNVYADEVYQDIHEAETLNIRGVPFFVINNRYAVSGAQATEVFLNTMKTAYSEWQLQPKNLEITDGPSCDADGNC